MFVVYSKDNCPACNDAKKHLDKLGKNFKVVKVVEFAIEDGEISKEDFVSKFPGVRSVPYIIGPQGEIYKNFIELSQNVK